MYKQEDVFIGNKKEEKTKTMIRQMIKVQCWVVVGDSIGDEEIDLFAQFSILMTERRIDQIVTVSFIHITIRRPVRNFSSATYSKVFTEYSHNHKDRQEFIRFLLIKHEHIIYYLIRRGPGGR